MVIERRYGKLSYKVISKRGMGCRVSVVFENEECFRHLSAIGTALWLSFFFETHKVLVADLQKMSDS